MPITPRSKQEIADEIRRIRKRTGLSLDKFSRKAGKPGQQSQFGHYENGRKVPSLDTLVAISRAAEVPLDVFFDRSETGVDVAHASRLREQVSHLRDTADRILSELDSILMAVEVDTPDPPASPTE
jgi:transcriptional regulator with XRE-family HTH domain